MCDVDNYHLKVCNYLGDFMKNSSIKVLLIAALMLIIAVNIAPAQDSVYIWYGNLDGSPISAELNSNLEIKVYAMASLDVSVVSFAFNLGAYDIVFDSLLCREHGEYYYPFNEWDMVNFTTVTGPPVMPQGWHNQCLFGIKEMAEPYDSPPFDSETPILIAKYVYHVRNNNSIIGSLSNCLGPGKDRAQDVSYAADSTGTISYPIIEYFSPVQIPGGGWISGNIIDNFGEPVPYVEVICHTSMLSVISSAEGEYTIGVAPGTHDLEFAVEGYRDILEQGITVSLGQSVSHNAIMEIGVDVDDNYNLLIPDKFELKQNYPNPFNATTTIEFSLTSASYVLLTVFDVQGRLVETLVDGKYQAGDHRVNWNAGDMPSGVYLYKIKTDDRSVTNRMLLVK